MKNSEKKLSKTIDALNKEIDQYKQGQTKSKVQNKQELSVQSNDSKSLSFGQSTKIKHGANSILLILQLWM